MLAYGDSRQSGKQLGSYTLVARGPNGLYDPQTSFLKATVGHNRSYTSWSIMEARSILTSGGRWRISDGCSARIWGDRWLSHSDPKILFMPQPADGAQV